MWSSTSAPIGIVPKLMHMHASLGIWIIALDVICDRSRSGLGSLLEVYGAGDLGVPSDYGD